MAALAMMGLSACEESTPSCKAGSQKCASNSVYSCIDGSWEVSKTCSSDEVCKVKSFSCETKTTCKNGDKRCNDLAVEVCIAEFWQTEQVCKGATICNEANHQCEERPETCETGAKRCENNKLYTCMTNGTWGTGVACAVGSECINDASECTDIGDGTCKNDEVKCVGKNLINCVDNKWATTPCASACDASQGCVECTTDTHCPSKKPSCENMQCYGCKSTAASCLGNTYKYCKADQSGYEIKDCSEDQKAPHCVAKAGCVECRDDKDCVIGQHCEADHTCKTPSAASSINWCSSLTVDVSGKSSTGRVLDRRMPQNADTITAKLLCGHLGQKLTEYVEIAGSYNADCLDCGDKFEYRAPLDSLFNGAYLCLWSFSLPDEKTVVCKKDGSLITDLDAVPLEDDALLYAFDWDHVVDFENFKATQNYDNNETVVVGDITTYIDAAVFAKGSGGSIDANTVVFSSQNRNTINVKHKFDETYVGVISFDYKGFEGDDFGTGDQHKLLIYLDWDPDIVHSITLQGPIDTVQTVVLPLHTVTQSFQLVKDPVSKTRDAPRLLIDNIRWTNRP